MAWCLVETRICVHGLVQLYSFAVFNGVFGQVVRRKARNFGVSHCTPQKGGGGQSRIIGLNFDTLIISCALVHKFQMHMLSVNKHVSSMLI